MVERVRFGDLGGGEFGIKVSRAGFSVDADDAPNLYSALDSQQIVQSGRVLASEISNTFGVSTFHSFGTTYGYVPVVLFDAVLTTESDNPGTQRILAGFDYENIGLTNGTLYTQFSVNPTTTGFNLVQAWRRVISGSYVVQIGWALDYYVTKMELP